MTEREWMAATHPMAMLGFLHEIASARKLRLFVCGYSRQVWDRLNYQDARTAISVAERYADKCSTDDDLNRAHAAATSLYDSIHSLALGRSWHSAIHQTDALRLSPGCRLAAIATRRPLLIDLSEADFFGFERPPTLCVLIRLLHDILGNPFRASTIKPTWLTTTVTAIASGIYEDRAFDRMPILGDALQDADCDNENILNHCRHPGEHVRGCWVIDLLTGRN